MALTIGELVATVDVDPAPAAAGIRAVEAGMHHLGAEAVTTGELIHRGLEEAVSELPEVTIDANTAPADREIADIRARLEAMSHQQISVDISTERAQREADALRGRLEALGASHPEVTVQAQVQHAVDALDATLAAARGVGSADPTVQVHADTASATAGLAHVAAAATAVGHMDPHIRVHADGREVGVLSRSLSGLWGMLGRVGSAVGLDDLAGKVAKLSAQFIAAAPLAAGMIGTLVNIAPAAAVGATAVLSLVGALAAIKIGTSGIGGAIKAAFAPAVSGGGSAAKATNAVADAQRNLQRATTNAAYANKQAAQQTASAERDLAAAQRSALAAQRAINDARHQAVRDLQDLNNSLIDAKNSEADAQNSVEDAAGALRQAQATGDPEAISRAQLAYNEAVQALKEQQLQVQRLTDDTAKANKAGVEGSKTVVDAKANEAQAVQDVRDKTLALSNAQEQQARTAQQGADAILQAKEALAQAGAAAGGGAGGVDAFAAAMAKLAPNARAFVREIISLGPAWTALKLDVQQRLFAGLAGALAAAAAVDLPIFRRGLDTTAGSLNAMALGVLGAARSLGKSGVLGQALDGAAAGLHSLVRIPGQVVTALTQVAAAGAPQFQKLTAAIGSGADTLAAKIAKSFTSGGMSTAIDTAVNLIKEIGTVLGNVGSIIGSVMGAAADVGGGWLGVLTDITGALKQAFASPEIQAGLKALFSVMATLGKTLAPLLAMALSEIAPILTALGPPVQLLIENLGAALQPVIKALGPVLVVAAQSVGALLDALSPLLPIIGDLIAAILPILTPVLKALGTIFGKLAGPIKEIATALATALQPIIEAISTVVDDLVSQYLDSFMQILGLLLPLIPQLTPVLLQLGTSLGQILEAVAPLLPQIMMLSVTMITQLLPAIIPLIPPLLTLTTMLITLATDVILKVVIPAMQFLVDFMGGLQKKLQPAIDAIKWLTTGISDLFEWLADHLVGHSVIPDMINAIVGWFLGLPGRAVSAIASLPGRIASIASDAARRMVSAISAGVSSAVSAVRGLPSKARAALGNLGSYLFKSGAALINGFIDGIKSKIGAVGNAVSNVLGFAKDHFPNSPAKRGPFSGKGWTYHSGLAVARDWAAGLDASHAAVAGSAAGLMGAAAGGFGGLGLPGAGSLAGARAGGGNSGGVVRHEVVLSIEGGADPWARAIRETVRVKGGGGPNSVQRAFG